MFWFWVFLCIFVVSIIIEVSHTDLIAFWFAIGAFCSAVAELCKATLWVSIPIFVVLTLVGLIFVRPYLKNKYGSEKITDE